MIELKNVLRVVDPLSGAYYLGTLTPPQIKQLTFVPVVATTDDKKAERLNEEPGGYQRSGDPRRMEKIRDFIMDRPSCVVPPVLLSLRGGWEFKPSSGSKSHGTLVAETLAAIIDGQHRLGGLWLVARSDDAEPRLKERPIPFMAIEEMDAATEKQEFVDINDNQKGVKKSLLRYLDRQKKFSGMAAMALMEEEDSPFKGRIDIQKKHDWQLILFGAMQECVELLYDRDLTATKNFNPHEDNSIREQAIEYTLRYWRTVRDSLPQYWVDIQNMPALKSRKTQERRGTTAFQYRLLEETGIRAFSKLGSELFVMTWIEGVKAPSFEAIGHYLSALGKVERVKRILTKPKVDPSVLEIDPDLKSTGKAGVTALVRQLRAELFKIPSATES